ncbi:MAG: DUF4402 domain-containing protein [Melioribacteraceae bacterium]|nr:DUF4402 domain-containing protein [Melioribacteraceae bacterium]
MKTLQNTIAVVALATLLFSSNVFAQTSASSSASVSIYLAKGLSITNVDASIDFLEYVAAGQAGSASVAVGSAAGANFKVSGEAAKNVTVTYGNSNLTNGTDNLTFVPDVAETGASATYSGASNLLSGNTASLNTGDLYLWIGGDITIPSNVSEGTYTGTFNFTVAY